MQTLYDQYNHLFEEAVHDLTSSLMIRDGLANEADETDCSHIENKNREARKLLTNRPEKFIHSSYLRASIQEHTLTFEDKDAHDLACSLQADMMRG
jgi:hypothetical protein